MFFVPPQYLVSNLLHHLSIFKTIGFPPPKNRTGPKIQTLYIPLNFPPPLFLSPPFLLTTSPNKKTHRHSQQTHLVCIAKGTVGQVPKKSEATLPGALCLHLGTALPRSTLGFFFCWSVGGLFSPKPFWEKDAKFRQIGWIWISLQNRGGEP